ncbi:hypothetical protein PSCICM_01170 [Pseudomonas cichorii]|nr:hypothetical protein PSCICM_01170 [Pseudomonas cichorii]
MATVVEAAGIIRVVAALAGRVVQALVPVAALADDPVPGSIWTARQPSFVAAFHHGAFEHDVNRASATMFGHA